MFSIERDGSKVVVRLDPKIPVQARIVKLEHDLRSEMDAFFFAREMQRVIEARMKAIREEAYREGWCDAKAKRRRADWWRGDL